MSSWARQKGTDEFERARNNDTSDRRAMIGASLGAGWRGLRVTRLLAAALIGGIVLAAPALAQVSDQPPAVTVSTLTPKRIAASTAVLVGLIGAVIGGLALARSTGRLGNGNGRRGAIVALVMGPIGLGVGGLVVATADGGLGTGNGIAGGVVAVAVGLIGMALGGLALARSRHGLTAPRTT